MSESITESLKRLLAGPVEPETEAETGAEALALTAYRAALKGNDRYFKLIRDMTEEAGTENAVLFCFGDAERFTE